MTEKVIDEAKAESVLTDSVISRFIAGETEAWGTVHRYLFPKVERFFNRVIGCPYEAEDLAQNTIFRLRRAAMVKPFDEIVKICFTIAHNQAMDYFRRKKRERDVLSDVSQLKEATVDRGPADRWEEDITWVQHAISGLSERSRDVLRLTYWEDFSPLEIAVKLKLTSRRVRGIRDEILAHLRKAF